MNKFFIHKWHRNRACHLACPPKPRRRREAARRATRVLFALFTLLFPLTTFAQELHYQHGEQIYSVMPLWEWKIVEHVPTFRGRELILGEGELPDGIVMEKKISWDVQKIEQTLRTKIADVIDRPAGSVVIDKDESGKIFFEGIGLPGREMQTSLAAQMTVKALEEGINTIRLPIIETNPEIVVKDTDLQNLGIREVVSTGESDYSRSPANRRYNIALGLKKFNGHLVKKEEEFSFNKTLGPVNATSGFLEELTIMGEKTLPAYGGGLCQVSTTAYRGAWKAGLPITSRRNHSYAVSYYAPAGTDATIFPPWTDMKFANDTDGAILIQTHHEGNNAYFIYYGTLPKEHDVELVGPFNWDYKNPPPDKTEYTIDIPPGETRIVSRAVTGVKSMWYRLITDDDGEVIQEPFLSEYEARPYFEEIGIDIGIAPIFSTKKPDEETIVISDETTITIPRRGKRERVRR